MIVNYCNTWSATETLRLFAVQYPNTRLPSHTVINNYNKYVQFAVSTNRNPGNSGRRRTARTPANIALVRQALQANVNTGMTARQNTCPQVSPSSFNRITRQDLAFHPYRMERRQRLLDADSPRRLQYSQWLTGQQNRFRRDILVGDEATFPMNGRVSTHLVRHYAPRNNPSQNFTYDVNNSREKLLVWAGIIGDGTLIWPVFIDGNLNADRYLHLINDEVIPVILQHGRYHQNLNGSVSRIWWFQDGAPSHTAVVVRRRLQELFPGLVVGIGHNIEWPPRSPDLTPLDFFLWGHIKAKVYQTPPANLQVLRRRIQDAFRELRRDRRVQRRAMDAMYQRAIRCVARNGRHVEGRGGR